MSSSTEKQKPSLIKDLLEKEIPINPCYIEPGILPKGGTLLFGGNAKIGKSFLCIELGRALATGEKPFKCPEFEVNVPCKVLYIEQELGEIGLQKRVKTIFDKDKNLGLIDKNYYYMSKIPELKLETYSGQKILLDALNEVQPDVLILDPISKFHGLRETDNSDIEKLFNILEYYKKNYKDLSIVLSHHFKKPGQDTQFHVNDPLDPYNFRGASKWFDAPDTIITVQKQNNVRDLNHEYSEIRIHFELRHGEHIEDMILSFNKNRDLKILFERSLGRPKKLSLEPKVKTTTGEQKDLFK